MTFLQVLWFILIAVLWTGYLFLEGFSLGIGMTLPFVAKNDKERTQVIRTVGPVWDANEVWLLTAGGATFAAFPEWYATMFSGMYLALFLILVCLILRISAVEWRAKVASEKWRARWDVMHVVAAWLVPILFGVAFANLIQGMKIQVVDPKNPLVGVNPADVTPALLQTHVHNLTGGFFSLLTPYTILGGLMLAAVWFAHATLYGQLKTTGIVFDRFKALSKKATIVAVALVAVFALWGQFAYSSQKLFGWIPLVIAALAFIASAFFAFIDRNGLAFICSGVGIASAVAWVFASMFPSVMKSSIAPAFNLTIEQASSTNSTLIVMSIVAVILVPIVLGYTCWSYWKFRDRISIDDVSSNPGVVWDKVRSGANFLVG